MTTGTARKPRKLSTQHRKLSEMHRQDLYRSGLTDATIMGAGIFTVLPDEWEIATGRNDLQKHGVESLLAFPYPECDYIRYKLFPPITYPDGSTQKYHTRKHSRLIPYVPHVVQSHLLNSNRPLYIVEGEKKALLLAQHNMAVIGIPGVWSWMQNHAVLPHLTRQYIAYANREIRIIFDSDAWDKTDCKKALYALMRYAKSQGAKTVLAGMLRNAGTEIINGKEKPLKVGPDDFIVQHGPDALKDIQYLKDSNAIFEGEKKWYRSWQDRLAFERESEKQGKEAEPTIEQLIASQKPHTTLRAAQEFYNGVFYYGALIGFDYFIFRSDKREPERPTFTNVTIDMGSFDARKFSNEGMLRRIKGDTVQFHQVIEELKQYYKRFLYIKDTRMYLLLSLWTMGTYVHRIFLRFPYLWFRSPEIRSGKSRGEELISTVAFNATARTIFPSEPYLFRTPQDNCCTMILDELDNVGDKETMNSIKNVLNAGFEKGGTVPRLVKSGDDYVTKTFDVYCPKVIAGVESIALSLIDRSIPIPMQRKKRTEQVERFFPSRLTTEIQGIRDNLYMWGLCSGEDISEAYYSFDNDLEELDDRASDLWNPLFCMAALADMQAKDAGIDTDYVREIEALALKLCQVRDTGEGSIGRLIVALENVLRKNPSHRYWQPNHLITEFKLEPDYDQLPQTTKALAYEMQKLNFYARDTRDPNPQPGQKAKGRRYEITLAEISDLRERYVGSGPGDEEGVDDENVGTE